MERRESLVLKVALVAVVLSACITNTHHAFVCDPNCAGACNKYENGTCDSTCKVDYGFVKYKCQFCNSTACNSPCNSAGIYKCDGPNCTAQYAYDKVNQICKPCDVNCDGNCTVNGYGKCDSPCKVGYSLSAATNTCVVCDTNCTGGCKVKGAGKCDSWCRLGYSVSNATNYVCFPCDVNCIGNCTVKLRGKCDSTCNSNYTLDTTAYTGTYTCKVPVDGNWTQYYPTSNCTAPGEKTRSVQRNCTNPAPNYNGSLCLNSSGVRVLVEKSVESCPCDSHCNSSCSVQGHLKCDSRCMDGWGLNTTDYTCRQAINGGWGQWYPISNCTEAGQLTRLYRRDCNNPAPDLGGLLCANSSGLQSTIDTMTEACPCDQHCDSNCTTNGYLKCDSSCATGWGLNETEHTCHAPINGSWSEWYSIEDCTSTGQLTHTMQRDCDNPEPAYGGSLCTDSNGALSSTDQSQGPCPCDQHCNSSCTAKGYNRCDSSCVAGWGLNTTDYFCYPCNSPYCNGSCNAYGPGFCDGPCDPGYGVQQSSHVCKVCDLNCAKSGPKSGCNVNGASSCDGLCVFGYAYRNTTLNCGQCGSNCLSGCFQRGPAKCDGICSSGYAYDNSTYTCRACDSNCASNCSTPLTCDSLCKAGFVLVNSTCRRCDVNCAQVIGSCNSKGAGHCDSQCASGYALTATFTCSLCDSHCNKSVGCNASGPGFCDQCSPAPCDSCLSGYGLGPTSAAGKKACYPCATNCNSGCSAEGAYCCDSSCAIGTWRSFNSTCHICS